MNIVESYIVSKNANPTTAKSTQFCSNCISICWLLQNHNAIVNNGGGNNCRLVCNRYTPPKAITDNWAFIYS